MLEQAIDLEPRLPDGGPDLVARLAALMHDVGKPRTRRFVDDGTVTFHHHDVVGAKMTRRRMRALRFSNDEIDAVGRLVELHLRFHGCGTGEWTDSAVRRPSWATRATSSSGCTCSPARTPRPAAAARPSGSSAPTTSSRRISAAVGQEARRDPSPTSTATRSWRRSASDPGAGRRGVPVPPGPAHGPRPLSGGRDRGPAGVVGGPFLKRSIELVRRIGG